MNIGNFIKIILLMKSKLKSLREFDMFGHLITMNFNKRGNRHKTGIGAFFSIIIKFCVYSYVLMTFNTMFSKGENRNSTITSSQNIEKFG